MAFVFKLKRGGTEIDLVGGSGKFTPETWESFAEGSLVTETFLLPVEAATRAAVRAFANDVIEMLEAAVDWAASDLESLPVWLQMATDGETLKQAVVYSYRLEPASFSGVTPALLTAGGTQAVWRLAITRDREWEEITAATQTIATISGTGGVSDQTAVTGGQTEGRISLTRFTSSDGTLRKVWCGLHRMRLGNAGNIDGVVDLTNAYPADADVFAEAGAYGGSTIRVQFTGQPDWQFRAWAGLPRDGSSVTAEHYTGRWLVLLRAKSTFTTHIMARVTLSSSEPETFGLIPNALFQGPPVYIHESEYYLYEMGEFQFPPGGRLPAGGGESLLNYLRLNVEARRISGTGNFYADCLILIPAEHMMTIDNARLEDGAFLYVYTREDGAQLVETRDFTNEAIQIPTLTARDWRWPKEGAVVVFAGQRLTGHELGDDGAIQLTIYDRVLGYHD